MAVVPIPTLAPNTIPIISIFEGQIQLILAKGKEHGFGEILSQEGLLEGHGVCQVLSKDNSSGCVMPCFPRKLKGIGIKEGYWGL